MSSYRNRRIRRSDGIKAAVVVAAVIIVLVSIAIGLDQWQQSQALPVSAEATNEVVTEAEPEPIEYNGIMYTPRPQLETCLLMGIDVEGPAKGNRSYSGGGQADVQLLLVVDNTNQTWQVLQINRDSMVEVQVLGMTGEVLQTQTAQIATAHAYGDGTERSCRNAVTAVSNMLGGKTIDGYMSLNMDAVAILNDMVGGVPVTITSDFTDIDPSLQEGETITLQGQQALAFVRSRKGVDDETNLSRMGRQRQYLAALEEKMAQQDEEFVIRAYDAVSDYMVTDMGSGTVAELGEKMKTYEELPFLTIAGESGTDEEGSATYTLDQDSLQQAIMSLFYERT